MIYHKPKNYFTYFPIDFHTFGRNDFVRDKVIRKRRNIEIFMNMIASFLQLQKHQNKHREQKISLEYNEFACKKDEG